jgi:TolB-like protein/Tfp pilus assembly protein PilF
MAPRMPTASPEMVREQLAKIVASPVLAGSSRLRELLSFIVERTLDDRSDELKEYSLGVEVCRRPPSFDPRLDPIVRVQVSNLRNKLKAFYAEGGLHDPVMIELPRGTYIPRFVLRPTGRKALSRPPEASPQFASVAVLACTDLSPAQDQQYFCDGITEEIINALASIEEIQVVGRTSVFRFKGKTKDARDIGALLGVQTVLETSFRRNENQIRVTAHLTEVATGFALWSKTFNSYLEKVFAVQEEIARSIAKALRVNFTGNTLGRFKTWPSRDIETYNLYLLAKFHLNKRSEKGLRRSMSILEQILSKEASNAQVFSALAECHLLLAMTGAVAPSVAMAQAASFARKALSLDNELSDAHASLASVQALHEWDWSSADREFRTAIELGPNNATARSNYAFSYLLPMGRAAEAVNQLREVVKFDPLSIAANQMLAFAFYASRRYDEAIHQCAVMIDLEPTFARAHALRALALGLTGLNREAVREADRALSLSDSQFFFPNWAAAACVYGLAGLKRRALNSLDALEAKGKKGTTSSYWLALACAVVGKSDKAFGHLTDAFRMRDPWLVSVSYEPLADPIRAHRRGQTLIRKLGLPKTLSRSNPNS